MSALRRCFNFSAVCRSLGFRCSSSQISRQRASTSTPSSSPTMDDVSDDTSTPNFASWDEIGVTTDANTMAVLSKDLLVYKDFITKEEEQNLFEEVEPYLKRLKYEENHWDDAIHGFRETERKNWTEKNKNILNKVKKIAFTRQTTPLSYVHVLDLKATGVIKGHVDSVKFCGDTIAGLSLLSSCVMRLINEKNKLLYADILLPSCSLYIMRNRSRYEYTHEILEGELSKFKGVFIRRERRIAVICRNEPQIT